MDWKVADTPNDYHQELKANLQIIAPFYDADYRNFHEDLPLIIQIAQDCQGPVLELGCGTGRVLSALCQQKIPCTGIDLSPAMLARAQHRFGDLQPVAKPQLFCQDMRDFDLQRRDFSLAIVATNTLMHLVQPDWQRAALTAIHRHLIPQGRIVLDLFNPPVRDLVLQEGHWQSVDAWAGPNGAWITKWMQRDVDWTHQRQYTRLMFETLHPDDRLEQAECRFVLRFLWAHEVELLLAQCGFRLIHVWGSYTCAPLEDQSETMVWVAEKR